jgi:hypothetical protein
MASAYEVGTRAWQPDTAEGWVASELINKTVDGSKVKLTFQLENGETKDIEVSAEALQSGSDPSLPPLMNPTMLEASDDLTNLSHLNEPAGMFATELSPVMGTGTNDANTFQSCRQLGYDTCKRRSTLTVVSFLLLQIRSRESILSMFPAWFKFMLEDSEPPKRLICLPLLKRPSWI